jgi:hypothetical protein
MPQRLVHALGLPNSTAPVEARPMLQPVCLSVSLLRCVPEMCPHTPEDVIICHRPVLDAGGHTLPLTREGHQVL